ncbi:MAG: Synerg-CTERM sorting domain-containing protein, partial [Synergistaceae bacterium]|nr:Synerg-CTERM sorting domain-containing protein [Synergistaceae bacterium]
NQFLTNKADQPATVSTDIRIMLSGTASPDTAAGAIALTLAGNPISADTNDVIKMPYRVFTGPITLRFLETLGKKYDNSVITFTDVNAEATYCKRITENGITLSPSTATVNPGGKITITAANGAGDTDLENWKLAGLYDALPFTVISSTPATLTLRANSESGVGAHDVFAAVSGDISGMLARNGGQGSVITIAKRGAPSDDITPDTSWYDSGSSGPFDISTAEQLAGLAKIVNDGDSLKGKTVRMTGDINLNGDKSDWTSIGTEGRPFEGTFNGGGKSITNMDSSGGGLFGAIGADGVVENVTVSGSVTGDDTAGIVAGTNAGTISNVTVSGSVEGTGNIGGIAGDNSGTIKSVNSGADVRSYTGGAGGIAGNNSGTVNDATATGTTAGASGKTGGLVGVNETGGTVKDSNWITKSGEAKPGVGTGEQPTGDSRSYTNETSGDMPITTVTLAVTDITTDANGGFTITAKAYPEQSKNKTVKLMVKSGDVTQAAAWSITTAALADGALTFSPDSFEADGLPHDITATGAAGSYEIAIARAADAKELADFTLKTTEEPPHSGGGGCSAGFGTLLALAPLLALTRRKRR